MLTKKIQRYRHINDTVLLIFVFGSMIMGKEPLEELNLAIFKNWLDTRPKMEMHEPGLYPTILGFFARFLESVRRFGHSKCLFWHLKTGTFGKVTNRKSVLTVVPAVVSANIGVAKRKKVRAKVLRYSIFATFLFTCLVLEITTIHREWTKSKLKLNLITT